MISKDKLEKIVYANITIKEFKLINFIKLSDEEIKLVRNLRNSEIIRIWMCNDHIISEKEHKRFLNSLRAEKSRVYWLVKKDNSYVGVINLININWNHKNAYLGIYTNPEIEIPGKGKMLLSLILEVAFNLLNLHSLKLKVIEDNKVAIGLYRKFGFKEEGQLKDFVYKNNSWKDVIIMGMINPKEKNIEK